MFEFLIHLIVLAELKLNSVYTANAYALEFRVATQTLHSRLLEDSSTPKLCINIGSWKLYITLVRVYTCITLTHTYSTEIQYRVCNSVWKCVISGLIRCCDGGLHALQYSGRAVRKSKKNVFLHCFHAVLRCVQGAYSALYSILPLLMCHNCPLWCILCVWPLKIYRKKW